MADGIAVTDTFQDNEGKRFFIVKEIILSKSEPVIVELLELGTCRILRLSFDLVKGQLDNGNLKPWQPELEMIKTQ